MFWKFGLDIKQQKPASWNNKELLLKKLIEDFRINVVLDIGAYIGNYSKMLRKNGYNDTIIAFEPIRKFFEILEKNFKNDKFFSAYNLAIGWDNKIVDIGVSGNDESSSILSITEEHLKASKDSKYIERQRVQMQRLDDTFFISQDDNIMLKIDVQGLEDSVLRNGEGVLSKTKIIDIELSFKELYSGQISFTDILNFLEVNGFRIYNIFPHFYNRETGELLQCDVILVKG